MNRPKDTMRNLLHPSFPPLVALLALLLGAAAFGNTPATARPSRIPGLFVYQRRR